MRALTLHQPWASAIALGLKRIETRSWSTHYRGPLAIHAGKRAMRRAELPPHAHAQLAKAAGDGSRLPFGAIVAVVELSNVIPTPFALGPPWEREAAFGDFSDGRFGWLLDDLRPLAAPIATTGHRGLWTPSEALLESIERMVGVPA